MAVADNDDPPMTINDELRLTMGQRGDDEDNAGGRRSCSATLPCFINVATNDDDDDVIAGATSGFGSASATVSIAKNAKRTRMSTSDVWNDFKMKNGVEVRYAMCHIFNHVLTARSTQGIGH